ncbi:MAG: serine hydrolase domain-containing protein, partial [Atribacterota bacterium]
MKREIFKNIAILIVFILLVIWGQAAVLTSSDRIQTFEQKIESLRGELNIPGMSVAILQGQEIIFNQGFGYADVENKMPATENT